MSELDEFKATYFDECSELLIELEEQFIAIEEGDQDTERLNAVFRAIHSIKGGAGAFGFQSLVGFAHSFETLLDYVRDGRVELTEDVTTLCIRSVDLVADFVTAAQEGRELGADYGADEKRQFDALCNPDAADDAGAEEEPEDFDIDFTPVMVSVGDEPAEESDQFEESPLDADLNAALMDDVDDSDEEALAEEIANADVVFEGDHQQVEMAEQDEEDDIVDMAYGDCWRVVFTPLPALYERANDPLLLFREMSIIGDTVVHADLRPIPPLQDFEPFQPYCAWTIYLKGDDVTEERIREVFEFVEGDCEIEITPPGGISEQQAAHLVGDISASAKVVVKPEEMTPAVDEPVEGGDISFAALAGELGVSGLGDAADEPEAPATTEASAPEIEAPVEAPAEQPSAPEASAEVVSEEEEAAADASLTALLDAEKEKAPAPAPTPATAPAPAAAATPKPAAPKAPEKAPVQSIRVDLDKVDRVVNMVGELVITQSMLTQQMDETLREKYQELVRGIEVLAQTTRGLQDSVMAIRAQPVKSVFSRMPRLVRELASKTGKKIKLEMVGEQTEIDKTVIEQLSDPLTHMIRNSADHGVESVEKRAALGKPEQGTIRLSAEQAGGNILIIVEDDGAGINRERVLAIAKERGVVPPDQTPSDEQIDNLIFAPGFSTATEVSDISGRGVGMDVVLSNIKKIGGSVHVRSNPGRGTRMTLRLPLTLAVLDVMLVSVAGCPYVVPLSSIVETIQAGKADFGKTPSGARLLSIRGEYVQVADLATRFSMHTTAAEQDRFVVLCEADGSSKIALVVDEIIGQQQVVIKSLEENYERIDGIAGGTILGDGQVALIVDVQGLKGSNHRNAA
ncbi:two-component system chemotaxis sensor kinase CheA [Maritalea mobilis]|uniref:Chemotaxis protein CheA n=1 Tax=Maritalea mobilis TaxID=483324 RepID=A0A4R6VKN3_9HYPH|nr:chemotaxis protein CheA [Maritalea mobilis]TDQ64219.1 two-component system chemotaxis sensor kinase CheA [Maritalea mobilis]